MDFARFVISYFKWHYFEAFFDMYRVLTNYLWFVYNFFSIPDLLHTLFSPWKRMSDHSGKFIENLIVNLMMRFVGFFLRILTILIGLLSLIFVLFSGVAVFLVWVFIPIIIPVLLVIGIFSLGL